MYHLMIVDDEDKIRSGISSYFPWEDIGYKVVKLASNGQEAFEFMLGDERVDVILCDIMMPVMDGLELLEMMQESGFSGVKVVILSGYREFEYARKAIQFGVREYLLKPTKYKDLSETFTKIKEELDQENAEATDKSSVIPSCTDNSVIQRVKKLVREQYQTISLQEAADKVHLNSFYLSKLFKTKTGQNFYDFLLRTRMEAAVKLLSQSDYKVYEISEMVGYKNQKSFLKIFKRYYGMNPSEYRKDHFV